MRKKILIIEDDEDTTELLDYHLRAAGYSIASAADGEQGLRKAEQALPDLILLDLMLPEVDGLEVCKILQRNPNTSHIPILMLTAKSSEIDRVLGLELGANDYVTKPFSPREIVLRVKKLLRFAQPSEHPEDVIRARELCIDVPRHLVTVGAETKELTPTEFKLLTILAQRRGRVQSREALLHDVWEYEGAVDTRTVDTHMRRLREKLGAAARYLDTVRGVGYRFLED